MAWRPANLPYWLDTSTDPSQSQFDPTQTDQFSSGATFNQLLQQLNASQWQTTDHWNPGSWHNNPDSTDTTVDVTSSSVAQSSAVALSSTAALSGTTATWLGNHSHHWHSPTPDHPGTLTVTSSDNGFVEGAVVTAHVTDPDGVVAKSLSYQWTSTGADNVSHTVGANSASYTLTASDVGNQIDVVATYVDWKGHHDTAADPFVVADPVDPTNPNPPPANSPGVLSVSSTDGFNEGSTVTASVTDVDGVDPNAVVYTWQQLKNGNWTDVGTGQSHTIGFTDGGNDFRVIATYTDNAGNPEAPQPVALTAVDLNRPGDLTVTSSGNGFVEGDVVTAHVSDADGVDPAAITYQWSSIDAKQVSHPVGNDSPSYTLTAADVGNQIDVVATYTDLQGHTESPADPFTVVAAPVVPDPPPPPPPPPANSPGVLSVTSTNGFKEGATLTASVTDADGLGAAPVAYTWQEQINSTWTNVGTGQTRTIGVNDGGNNFRVLASYTDGAGHAEAPTPVAFTAVDVNQPGTVTVTSSGSGFVEGSTLTAKVTDADGLGAATVLYTWQEQINNAWTDVGTGQTHALGFSDGGHNFRVVASYTDAAGHAESPVSQTISAVDVDRPGTLTVTSSGSGFAAGDAITASVTDPDGVNAGSVAYQWSSMGTDNLWHAISGATAASYTLTAADAGHQIDVVATYVDNQGHHDTAADPFSVAAASSPPPAQSGLMLGVNLAGADFGSATPGVFGKDYTFPTDSELDYYASKGMTVMRVPVLWERIQDGENGPLDAANLARMDELVKHAALDGEQIIIDIHNYAKGFGADIGTAQTTNAEFADLWSKLAAHYKNDSNVIFGLMNEPHDQTASAWLDSANTAIAAIRATGATQEILVPGSYWTGAWTWVSSDNDTTVGTGVKDPLNNYAFEVHQYLDSDGSGTHNAVVSTSIGVDRLTAITQWAESHGAKLFLGEFGVGTDATSLTAMDNMLTYMQAHSVWQGATYWAGGPWWGNSYWGSIEPANGVDKPQMTVMEHHLPTDVIPLSG